EMSEFLFEEDKPSSPPVDAPLADRMRPKSLDEILGQGHLLDPGKPLRIAIERDQVPSMILWGPPGVGKTTLAQIIAKMTKSTFIPFSAVMAGIKEIKEIMTSAEKARRTGRRTIVLLANGDARTALNILDLAVRGTPKGQPVTKTTIEQASQRTLLYDKAGEEHYNIISALHKSLRNSDADAALYWLARMLEAGE